MLNPPTDTPTSPPVLVVRDATKTYTGTGPTPVQALRGVSLSVGAGQFTAIMGPSGSGKSTLLNVIGGLEPLDGGDILVEGVSLVGLADSRLSQFRRRKLGFIFQQLNLLPTLTAAENVALPLLIDGHTPASLTDAVRRALTLVGLADRETHRPDHLSGGEQQRVAIARCLLTAPAVILADEPTGNLDSRNSRRVLTALRDMTRGKPLLSLWDTPATEAATSGAMTGATPATAHAVVMVTHEAAAAAFADEILFLRDGQLVGREILDTDAKHHAAFVADSYQRHTGATES